MIKPAYDIAVKINAPFDEVVKVTRVVEEASNIYWEIKIMDRVEPALPYSSAKNTFSG